MKNKIAELIYDCQFDKLDDFQKLNVLNLYIDYTNFVSFNMFYTDNRVLYETLECYLCYLLMQHLDSMDDCGDIINEIVDMSLEVYSNVDMD